MAFAANPHEWLLWYGKRPNRRMSVYGFYSVRCRGLQRDRIKTYTAAQVDAMLRKAEKMGYSLEAGCELESFTLVELDELVNGTRLIHQ